MNEQANKQMSKQVNKQMSGQIDEQSGEQRIVNEKDIKWLLKRDKIFAAIHKQYGPPPDWSREPGFISLSKIILEQQVSLASANAHFQKLNTYVPEFSPAHILNLTDEEMHTCQISRQKAKYLRELSTAISTRSLDLEGLSLLGEPEVRTVLTAIKGIGHWTTDIYLMFCLQSKDIFPIGDIAVVNTVKEFTQARTQEQILALAEKWRPLRSLATYFLWHNYLKKRNRS
ncbi:MAG TPA: DNA-3-methyladenine glycosylase 2 family protein [Puia sp.]|jgi:DNA-3-methyladenine glycosylase II|nr:DNA-3-methyladenine glycosylase 2 family protein [Puia sp.]